MSALPSFFQDASWQNDGKYAIFHDLDNRGFTPNSQLITRGETPKHLTIRKNYEKKNTEKYL